MVGKRPVRQLTAMAGCAESGHSRRLPSIVTIAMTCVWDMPSHACRLLAISHSSTPKLQAHNHN